MNKIFGAKKKKLMELDGQPYYVYDCSTGPEVVYEDDVEEGKDNADKKKQKSKRKSSRKT